MSSPTIYSQHLDTHLASIRFQCDWIRFPEYRCALKLFLVAKKANLHLIGLFDILEAIREYGLQSVHYSQHHNHQVEDPFSAVLTPDRLEEFLRNVYLLVNKRLPSAQNISNSIDECIGILITVLTRAFGPVTIGVRVMALKITLAILCSGKLVDKLRYIYTLLCDDLNGMLVMAKFNSFLSDSIRLTHIVSESDTYRFSPSLIHSLFDFSRPVMLADFIELFLGAAGPPDCLAWIVVFDRLSQTEFLTHQTTCNACGRTNFTGLRYKCQRCFSVTLCQDCFWRGRVTGQHNPDTHPCKEYSYWKGPTKQLSHSLRKSFRCVPGSRKTITVQEEPPLHRRVNLTNLVPPSPLPARHNKAKNAMHNHPMSHTGQNMQHLTQTYLLQRYDSNSAPNTPYSTIRERSGHAADNINSSKSNPSYEAPNISMALTGDNISSASRSYRVDDDHEHILIRGLTEKLRMADQIVPNVVASDRLGETDSRLGRIAELEAKNREIMAAIRSAMADDVLDSLTSPVPQSNNALSLPIHEPNSFIPTPPESLLRPMLRSPPLSDESHVGDISEELALLTSRKDELESHLTRLQENREYLISELETLTNALKSRGNFIISPPTSSEPPTPTPTTEPL